MSWIFVAKWINFENNIDCKNRFQEDIYIMIAFILNFKKILHIFIDTNKKYGQRQNQHKNGVYI